MARSAPHDQGTKRNAWRTVRVAGHSPPPTFQPLQACYAAAMRISDLARRTGTPTTTLRHYERLGLLRPTRAPNGYRDYPESAVREVIFIAMARQIGIGLKRIAEHLPAYRTGRLRAEQMTDAMRSRIAEIDTAIEALRMQRQQIIDHIRWIETRTTDHRHPPPTPDEHPPDAET